jgi:hypothetical protein
VLVSIRHQSLKSTITGVFAAGFASVGKSQGGFHGANEGVWPHHSSVGVTPNNAAVRLDLVFDAETISGSLHDTFGNERSFSGWLELASALEQIRTAAEDPLPRDRTSRTSPGEQCR